METKRCTKCGEEKPITEFYLNRRSPTNKTRRRQICIQCHCLNTKRYSETHKSKINQSAKDRYYMMMDIQNRKCYLAKARKLMRGEVVDPHCDKEEGEE